MSRDGNDDHPVYVRRAVPADAKAIWRVHVGSIRGACAADYTPEQIEAWAGPKTPERYVRAMAGGEAMWVAVGPDDLVGFAALRGEMLIGLYVAPTALRRGVGTALLHEVEAEAVRRGVEVLRLHATLTARAFYLSHGYEGEQRLTRDMGGVALPCIPMSKRLPPLP